MKMNVIVTAIVDGARHWYGPFDSYQTIEESISLFRKVQATQVTEVDLDKAGSLLSWGTLNDCSDLVTEVMETGVLSHAEALCLSIEYVDAGLWCVMGPDTPVVAEIVAHSRWSN